MLDQITIFLHKIWVVVGALIVILAIVGAVKFGVAFLKQLLWVAIVVAAIIFIVPNL
ncbi:hypothetical protein ABIC37_005401 [Priestia megaterium]|uniref:hypothetical protein n=1 Tax=Priestia megaterium TaxID=1404 RepID=UPI00339A09A3